MTDERQKELSEEGRNNWDKIFKKKKEEKKDEQ